VVVGEVLIFSLTYFKVLMAQRELPIPVWDSSMGYNFFGKEIKNG